MTSYKRLYKMYRRKEVNKVSQGKKQELVKVLRGPWKHLEGWVEWDESKPYQKVCRPGEVRYISNEDIERRAQSAGERRQGLPGSESSNDSQNGAHKPANGDLFRR